MNSKSFLVCFIVLMMATSVAMAGGRHGNFGGGFARGGSFHRGNWNHHCHGGRSSFVFTGSFGFPYFGYPYGYGYGSGQLMIGTLLMLFFGLPSMTRSLYAT